MINRQFGGKLWISCCFYIFPYMSSFSQTGTILKGKIIDKELKSSIEYFSAAAYFQKGSSFVEGGIIDAKGDFSFRLPLGNYRIKERLIGYLVTVVDFVTIANS